MTGTAVVNVSDSAEEVSDSDKVKYCDATSVDESSVPVMVVINEETKAVDDVDFITVTDVSIALLLVVVTKDSRTVVGSVADSVIASSVFERVDDENLGSVNESSISNKVVAVALSEAVEEIISSAVTGVPKASLVNKAAAVSVTVADSISDSVETVLVSDKVGNASVDDSIVSDELFVIDM